MRTLLRRSLAFVFFVIALVPALAEGATYRASLADFVPDQYANLRCISGEYSFSIPVPDRWKVLGAQLQVDYINSSNLTVDSSQLIVRFNHGPFNQVRLDPISNEGKMDVHIPLSLFKKGYNELNFHAIQHYNAECENPCAPDLWTNVNLRNSFIELEYVELPVPLNLSRLSSFIFDAKLPNPVVNIIAPDSSLKSITAGSVTASGLAHKFIYRSVAFDWTSLTDLAAAAEDEAIRALNSLEKITASLIALVKEAVEQEKKPSLPEALNPFKQGMDNVLIGEYAQIAPLLAAVGIDLGEVTGPFLKLVPLPTGEEDKADPYHALLIVTGLNEHHMLIASETLASMTFPYPGTGEMTVLEFELPDITLYSGKQMLDAGVLHKFKELDFRTHTFKGLQGNPRDVVFRLPPDFFIRPNEYAKVGLNFAYGPGLRNDSVLNIQLNGTYVRAINLSDPDGANISGYEVDIPTYLFKPGNNILRLQPILTPAVKMCDLVQAEAMFATVFENSTLFFPKMSHNVMLPDLSLFMVNGFPYTRWPDGYESLIYLTENSSEIISSSLNVVGLLTQKNGYPLFALTYALDEPATWNGDLLVIGSAKTLPLFVVENTPLKMTKKSVVPYPMVNSFGSNNTFAMSTQLSGLGLGVGAIMQFQSPFKQGKSIMLMTAQSPEGVAALASSLSEGGVQTALEGDLVLIDLSSPGHEVSSMRAGRSFFTGKKGEISMLEFYLYTYPWLYYAAIGLMAALISMAIFAFVRSSRRRRLSFAGIDDVLSIRGIWQLLKKLLFKSPPKRDDEDD